MKNSRAKYLKRIGGHLSQEQKDKRSVKVKAYYASLTDEQRRIRAENCRKGATTEKRRKEMSERFKRLWKDPEWVASRKDGGNVKGRTLSCKRGISKMEIAVKDWVKSVSPYDVESKWKGFVRNPHMEIDIYIPEIKLGIEVSGTYWHSTEHMKEKDKLKKALCDEMGIKLLVVTDKDWGKYDWQMERIETKQRILNAIDAAQGLKKWLTL